MASFERAVDAEPQWAEPYKYLGLLYAQYAGREQEGVALLEKALDLDPDIDEAEKMRALIKSYRKVEP